MKIIINSEDELISKAEEAINILINLRKFSTLWEQSYGVELKNKKKMWEGRADEFLKKLNVPEFRYPEKLKIKIEPDEKSS
jgi:hypothetical protein